MKVQGLQMQGLRAGGKTLREIASGLLYWLQPKTGTNFYTGNNIASQSDISGNTTLRNFTAWNTSSGSTITAAMQLQQSGNNAGLGMANGDGVQALACVSDTAFKHIFYSGAPMMYFIVFQVNNTITSSGLKLFYTGGNAAALEIAVPKNGNMAIRTLNASGAIIANNDVTGITPGGYIICVMDYGYNSASADKHRKVYVNNVLKSEVKFTAAPSSAVDGNPIYIQSGGINANGTTNNWVKDHACFDNAGKTVALMDAERTAVYQYFLAEYPNMFT